MKMLAFLCLAIAWGAIGGSWALHRFREGRPGSSVHSFRRQLSTLERATPGTTLRPLHQGAPAAGPSSAPVRRPRVATAPSHVVKRRRDVLIGLLGATAFTFLLLLVASSALTFLLFVLAAGALGAYCYALVQIRMRAEEAAVKVRVLRPQASHGTHTVAVRRTAN
ncbi:MAG: hypothetical protein KDB04_17320 [Acidimicrobiales bacterium]|nr:hypothetical protein [Acidimicrobiales bacterium]HRW37032.1 hypothetical protein [Aquihabitans sp.]